jgi:hypothetical protein
VDVGDGAVASDDAEEPGTGVSDEAEELGAGVSDEVTRGVTAGIEEEDGRSETGRVDAGRSGTGRRASRVWRVRSTSATATAPTPVPRASSNPPDRD